MLLIFDCDGVLIDSEVLHSEIETDIIHETMHLTLDPTVYRTRFVGTNLRYAIQSVSNENDVPFPDNFVELVDQRKQEVFATKLQSIPHVTDALSTLGHYNRCVASNTRIKNLGRNMKFAEVYDLFAPHIFSAELVEHPKPAPDLYLYAANQFGVAPTDCLVIEDSPAGIQAAKSAGMSVLGFTGGSHCDTHYAERLHAADLIFDDMRNLPDLVAKYAAHKTFG